MSGKKLYANQNLITFQSTPRNQNNPFGIYNKEALFSATNNLSSCALKLYVYLGSFQEMNGGLYLSKQDVLHKMSMSEKSYFSAKKELKEKGYLIRDESSIQKGAYIFIERPYTNTPQIG